MPITSATTRGLAGSYVVHPDTELSVIDATNDTPRSSIALPKSLGAFQLETGRLRMYINAKAGQVVAIDSDKDEVIGRFPVAPAGVNAALAIDEPNHRLFVGCRRDPSLVVMGSDTGKIVARVPILGDVDDLSFDTRRGRIYASCSDGAIAVIHQINADRYEVADDDPPVTGAQTSIFHADLGRLYLAVPGGRSDPIRKTRRFGCIKSGSESAAPAGQFPEGLGAVWPSPPYQEVVRTSPRTPARARSSLAKRPSSWRAIRCRPTCEPSLSVLQGRGLQHGSARRSFRWRQARGPCSRGTRDRRAEGARRRADSCRGTTSGRRP